MESRRDIGLCALAAFVVFLAGCAGAERGGEEKGSLAERARRVEADLAEMREANARLREALEGSRAESASLRDAASRATGELAESGREKSALERRAKGLEEKNYDLEMAYGNLTEQIRGLKNELELREGHLLRAKQVIRESNDKVRDLEEKHSSELGAARRDAESAKTKAAEIEKRVESLDATLRSVRSRNEALEREVVQLPDLRKANEGLEADKRALESAQEKSLEDIVRLEGKLASLTGAAHAAGIELPAHVSAASEWEIVKRIATDRFARARSGDFAGDPLDWMAAGTAGALLLLAFSTAFFATAAVRARRRLRRRIDAEGAAIDPACGEETGGAGVDAPAYGEVREDTENVGEPFDEAEGTVAGDFLGEEGSEGAFSPAYGQGQGDAEEDLSQTQVIAGPSAPQVATSTETAAEDEDVLGDLRTVINKKFKELLDR